MRDMKTTSRFLLAACLLTLPLASKQAHAQCTNPAGVEGEIIHNETHNVPAYCDNTNWIAMTGADPATGNIAVPVGLVGHWRLLLAGEAEAA